jgi:hypothetical protein
MKEVVDVTNSYSQKCVKCEAANTSEESVWLLHPQSPRVPSVQRTIGLK